MNCIDCGTEIPHHGLCRECLEHPSEGRRRLKKSTPTPSENAIATKVVPTPKNVIEIEITGPGIRTIRPKPTEEGPRSEVVDPAVKRETPKGVIELLINPNWKKPADGSRTSTTSPVEERAKGDHDEPLEEARPRS